MEKQNKQATDERDLISYIDLFVFYLPLLINSGMMTFSGAILNFGVGRGVQPGLALASFTAGYSIMLVVNSLIKSLRNVYNTHLVDKLSFNFILRFYLKIGYVAFFIYLILGFSPLGDYIFTGILGFPKEIALLAKQYFIFISPVPLINVYRVSFQSVLTVYRKTYHRSIAIGIRLFSILLTIVALVGIFREHATMCAGISLTFGISLETIYLALVTREFRKFEAPTFVRKYDYKLTTKRLVKFLFPLWVSNFTRALSFPLITFFIGLTYNVKAGLAAYGILRSIILLSNMPLFTISTLVVIMGKEDRNLSKLRVFVIMLVVLSFLILGIIFIPTINLYILNKFYHLNGEALRFAEASFILLLFSPILISLRSYLESILLRQKMSKPIGFSGIVRVVSIFASGYAILGFVPAINGATLGVLLMVTYSLFEIIYLLGFMCLHKVNPLLK